MERPMRKFPRGTAQEAVPYIDLMRKFVSGKMTAPEFEKAYILLFGAEEKVLPEAVEKPINEVFYDVDDYVEDPELRADVDGIDGEQLRERAEVQLGLLVRAVENDQRPTAG